MKKKKRIGIMGGTFDPIHIGHLILGEKAYEQFHLDKVWFMPSGNPPHKRERNGCATDMQRTEMVRRAIEGNPHFELSLFEMNSEGYSYTYRTLEKLKELHPDTDFFFIIGADSLFDFDKWREPARICAACTLIVAVRDYVSDEKLELAMKKMSDVYHGVFLKLETTNLDISSHQLRRWILENQSIQYYVTDSVRDYICKNRIYQASEEGD